MSDPKLQVIPGESAPETDKFDPFAPENLRLDQTFTETVGVKKLLTTIPVKKPNAQTFFRVHPSPEYRDTFPIIGFKDDRDDQEYVVARPLVAELSGEFVTKTLVTAITRQGTLFLLPLRLPGPDGRDMGWWKSLREHAELAKTRWVRVVPNRDLGAYECLVAAATLSDPDWPERSFRDLLEIAFKDNLISSVDHPVIKRLRGLA
jgi:hypothetical protein